MILIIIKILCFFMNIMLTFCILYLCGIKLLPIEEPDRKKVGYDCRWEFKYIGAKLLHLLKLCYHMMGRSSDVTLSIFNDIRMENAHNNNVSYYVLVQRINRSKTSTYQELCIYPDREFIIYDRYWSMAYTCANGPYQRKLHIY